MLHCYMPKKSKKIIENKSRFLPTSKHRMSRLHQQPVESTLQNKRFILPKPVPCHSKLSLVCFLIHFYGFEQFTPFTNRGFFLRYSFPSIPPLTGSKVNPTWFIQLHDSLPSPCARRRCSLRVQFSHSH